MYDPEASESQSRDQADPSCPLYFLATMLVGHGCHALPLRPNRAIRAGAAGFRV
jgi:hypothetical protein